MAQAQVAAREDLSISERAAALGRTYAAVDNFLRAHRPKPKPEGEGGPEGEGPGTV